MPTLAALVCHVAVAAPQPIFGRHHTTQATRLREDLLRGYDKIVPPPSQRAVNYSQAGTEVALSIRFFKVISVKVAEGQMQLKVWMRTRWTDERLSWDPHSYGNVTMVHFMAHALTVPESSEIWLPDVKPYNSNQAIESTLEPALATVYPSGEVYWARDGLFDVVCKFSGLVAFPFDRLSCELEVAGWMLSGGFQGITLQDNGFELDTMQEVTAGSSYQEYGIANVSVQLLTFHYACCPNEPWPVARYTVTLRRASTYYTLLIIVPTLLLTYLSMGVFFMSHEVGERLSFGITLMLANEVTKITVAGFVPVCGELLWVDLFMLVSSLFCGVSLLETMIVLFLAYHTDRHLLPAWATGLALQACCHRRSGHGRDEALRDFVDPEFESCAGILFRHLNRSSLQRQQPCRADGSGCSPRPEVSQNTDAAVDLNDLRPESRERPKYHRQHSPFLRNNKGELVCDILLQDADAARLIFFERLFFLLDTNSRGYIRLEDAARLLSFISLSMDPKQRAEALRRTDRMNDGLLFRTEFMELCMDVLWSTPVEEIEMGAQNFSDAQSRLTKRYAAHWQSASKAVDRYCRFWGPLLYSTALGVLFNLDLTDTYGVDPTAPMFGGSVSASMPALGVAKTLVVPVLGLLCITSWLAMRRIAIRQKLLERLPANLRFQGEATRCSWYGSSVSESHRSF